MESGSAVRGPSFLGGASAVAGAGNPAVCGGVLTAQTLEEARAGAVLRL